MTPSDLIGSSLQSLTRTKGRSVLTMLGIVIGVMSVILMLSVGEAAQRYILTQVTSWGSDLLFITNGSEKPKQGVQIYVKQSLTIGDVKKLQSLPWVTTIVGKNLQYNDVYAQGETMNAQIIGTMPDELKLGNPRVAKGSFFIQSDVDSGSRVAVLGAKIAEKVFGFDDPLGKSIKIGNTNFRVLGVMDVTGTKGLQNIDKGVYIPITTALDLANTKYVTLIQTRTSFTNLEEGKRRLRDVLRDRHGIDNPADDVSEDDFSIKTQEDILKTAGNISNILQIFLISVAAISLLVGGIGIMNIMYVSVTERIREIGLRKSLGARRSDILNQFLVEAVIQTLIGGIVGTAIGILFTWIGITIISSIQSGWSFVLSTNGILLGLGVSISVGIIFGYFPAKRAASMTPIEALSSE
jgi:putative ABC transport system permease protein